MNVKIRKNLSCICVTLLLMKVAISSCLAAEPCALSLTYKEIGKHGYMEPAPSNLGLYQAIYTEAAEEMGCELSIHRYPKKRTHLLLQSGDIDLYPSTGFDEKRSAYLFYIPNGLHRYEPYFGLTPSDVSDLGSIPGINDAALTWIFEDGNTTVKKALDFNVRYEEISNLTDGRAIEMLSIGRRVFYRIIERDYERYLSKIMKNDLSHLNIKTHWNCCEPKSQSLYVGISRASNIIEEETNPSYDPNQALSAENFPTRLSTESVAHKLAKTLDTMRQTGRVNKLFKQYIK